MSDDRLQFNITKKLLLTRIEEAETLEEIREIYEDQFNRLAGSRVSMDELIDPNAIVYYKPVRNPKYLIYTNFDDMYIANGGPEFMSMVVSDLKHKLTQHVFESMNLTLENSSHNMQHNYTRYVFGLEIRIHDYMNWDKLRIGNFEIVKKENR